MTACGQQNNSIAYHESYWIIWWVVAFVQQQQKATMKNQKLSSSVDGVWWGGNRSLCTFFLFSKVRFVPWHYQNDAILKLKLQLISSNYLVISKIVSILSMNWIVVFHSNKRVCESRLHVDVSAWECTRMTTAERHSLRLEISHAYLYINPVLGITAALLFFFTKKLLVNWSTKMPTSVCVC